MAANYKSICQLTAIPARTSMEFVVGNDVAMRLKTAEKSGKSAWKSDFPFLDCVCKWDII